MSFDSYNSQQKNDVLIISPPGTESWYPALVIKVHKLLSVCELTLPYIFISLIYISRQQSDGQLKLDCGYELLLGALMLSQKQNSDIRYSNLAWAKFSGLSVGEVNEAERNLLTSLQWNLHIRDNEYQQWIQTMQSLGKDHILVLKATQMQEDEFKKFEVSIQSRPDLITEIVQIRRSYTTRI